MGGIREKMVIEGLASEVLVVQLGKTSKPVDTLMIPALAANNQPVIQTKVGSDNKKLSLNKVRLVLEIYHVCVQSLTYLK